jgi:Uncharacterized protein conserved in bacteria
MEKDQIRYDYLDLMKCIAIFFVVIYHFSSISTDFIKNNSLDIYIDCLFYIILSMCVPIFFFVNGALILNKNLDLKKHIKKIVKIVLLAYIWGIVTYLLVMVSKGEHSSINVIIKNILSWKQSYINYLWFLQALIVIYLFFPIIKNCYDNNKSVFVFFMITILFFTFGKNFLSSINILLDFFFHKKYLKLFIDSFNVFNPVSGIYGYSIGYFMLGGILFYNRNKFTANKYKIFASFCFIISLVLSMGYTIIRSLNSGKIYDVVWYGYDTIFTLIMVISFFILCLNYQKNGFIGNIIETIGKNSLGIYLVHFALGKVISPIYYNVLKCNHNNVFADLLLAPIIVFLSLFICIILKRFPILNQLVSI